ncbi:MAG: bifunctional precorrin-2 dehydrogenase/sirohydrochlorin ferrochelatase [Anaerolineae bacterium]
MMNTSGYPVLLKLEGRRCVVVGGGKVALRKTRGLLQAGAKVSIISPKLDAELMALVSKERIELLQSEYAQGMLAQLQPLLVFAATNSAAVNRLVVEEAQTLNMLAAAVDDSSDSDFSNMAVLRRGGITIGISTQGASPALSAHLKEVVAGAVGEEYSTLAEWLGEYRTLAQHKIHSENARTEFWYGVLNSTILEQLRDGDETQARATLDALWAEAGRGR